MQIEVLTSENGFVLSYNSSPATSSINGEIVDAPEDMADFEANFFCYKLEDGELVKDKTEQERIEKQAKRDEIRKRREAECFAVVDRSTLWYERLTEEQRDELREWYEAWLLAPSNLKVPKRPSFV